MLERQKPMTHVAWAQYSEGGRFREWVEVGRGRIESDGSAAYVYQNRFAVGGSTFTCLLPIGVRPPDPQPQAKRPQSGDDEDT
jgi:hypothetical protein